MTASETEVHASANLNSSRDQDLQYALTKPTGKKNGNIQNASHSASFTSQPPWCRYWSLLSLLYLTPIKTADMSAKNICTGNIGTVN